MPLLRAQCVFPYGSGLPEDVMTNTFHYEVPLMDPGVALDTITDALDGFYTSIHGTPGGWANYIRWDDAHINFYLMDLPPPRIPIVREFDFSGRGASTATDVPAESAIVMSFHGSQAGGQAAARRRGRVYLGGFTTLMMSSTDLEPARLHTTLVTNVRNAGNTLMGATSEPECQWIVWSQANGDGTAVTGGWVDNEPDTQRRRGGVATIRNIWP